LPSSSARQIKQRASGASSLLLNRDGMFVGAAVLGVVAFVRERPAAITWTGTAVISIVYLATVGSTLTFAVYMWLLRFIPASRMSLISFCIPVVALLVGAAFGGEVLGIRTFLGAGLVLGGVILAARPTAGTLR
jgi:drug/metabolite transporter (DMT)-like permease